MPVNVQIRRVHCSDIPFLCSVRCLFNVQIVRNAVRNVLCKIFRKVYSAQTQRTLTGQTEYAAFHFSVCNQFSVLHYFHIFVHQHRLTVWFHPGFQCQLARIVDLPVQHRMIPCIDPSCLILLRKDIVSLIDRMKVSGVDILEIVQYTPKTDQAIIIRVMILRQIFLDKGHLPVLLSAAARKPGTDIHSPHQHVTHLAESRHIRIEIVIGHPAFFAHLYHSCFFQDLKMMGDRRP